MKKTCDSDGAQHLAAPFVKFIDWVFCVFTYFDVEAVYCSYIRGREMHRYSMHIGFTVIAGRVFALRSAYVVTSYSGRVLH